MRTSIVLCVLCCFVNYSLCEPFTQLGMFKKNDRLVSSDTLFKERIPRRIQYAEYGKAFNCPITFVRVQGKDGAGKFPRVRVIRGGLTKKYIVMTLSAFDQAIYVDIYIGCAGSQDKPKTKPTKF